MPVVSWYHNGMKLENGSRYTVLEPSHERLQLIIHNVSRGDTGVYICKAVAIDSYSSQTKEFEINLHVEYSPKIIGEEDDEAYTSLGSVVNISCSANGQPAPRFFWFRDGDAIHNSPDHVIFHSANESILQMRIKSESQFGTYVCQASNVHGDKQKTIELMEGATPVAPVVSASNAEHGKVVLSIKMPEIDDNGLEVSGYKVKYALKSDPLNSTKFQEFTTSEEFVLTNMNYNSQYIIQVAARNAAGHGEYSEEITHETEALQMSSPVVTDSSSTSIKITSALLLVTLFICM